jgi:peptidoglycan/LPS O-acetylase OafA/YrhL
MNQLHYRKDINGLRAIAVLSVIFFHLKLDWFSGGFLGVDIFFVISGYLITSIITNQIENRQFSLLTFFKKRILRIIPALFFMIVFICLPLAWLTLTPNVLLDFSVSIIYLIFFISNFYFWKNINYFNPENYNPILHTWSLSVEFQFYILIPLIIIFIINFNKKSLIYILLIIFLTSLLMSHWAAYRHPSANFYFIFTRMWEFIAGYLVFFFCKNQLIRKLQNSYIISQIFSLLGFFILLFSFFYFNQSTRLPSLLALLPILGVFLIILFSNQNTTVYKTLSSKFLTIVGCISYSLYLIHYPIIFFSEEIFEQNESYLFKFIRLIVIFLLSCLSWKFIELPFKYNKENNKNRFFFIFLLGIILLIFSTAAIYKKGYDNRFQDYYKLKETLARPERTECFDRRNTNKIGDWKCDLGEKNKKSNFFVFGDSHAFSFMDTIEVILKKKNLSADFLSESSCLPLLENYSIKEKQLFSQRQNDCSLLNQKIFNYVKEKKINKIIFISAWPQSMTNYKPMHKNKKFSQKSKEKLLTIEEFKSRLFLTSKMYKDIGTDLIFIKNIPFQSLQDPGKFFLKNYKKENFEKIIKEKSINTFDNDEYQKDVNQIFYYLKDEIKFIDAGKVFCDKQKCYLGNINGVYYYDDNHLTVYGAKQLESKLLDIIF